MKCDSLIHVSGIKKLRLPAFKNCYSKLSWKTHICKSISSPLELSLVLDRSHWWETFSSLRSLSPFQQTQRTAGHLYHEPFLPITFMCLVGGRSRVLPQINNNQVLKSPPLFLCKLLVYSNTTDALIPHLLNKKEMVYYDLMLKLLRCRGEMWITKSRRQGF